MTLTQLLLIGAAVALVLSPTLRIVARWAIGKLVSYVEAEIRKALPALSAQVDKVLPDVVNAGVSDMRTVLDLATKLRDEGNSDAVKLCQQLIDQMLNPPKAKS